MEIEVVPRPKLILVLLLPELCKTKYSFAGIYITWL